MYLNIICPIIYFNIHKSNLMIRKNDKWIKEYTSLCLSSTLCCRCISIIRISMLRSRTMCCCDLSECKWRERIKYQRVHHSCYVMETTTISSRSAGSKQIIDLFNIYSLTFNTLKCCNKIYIYIISYQTQLSESMLVSKILYNIYKNYHFI